MATSKKSSARGGRSRRGGARRRKGGKGPAAPRQPQLTSLPTGRAAYVETREWLLDRWGPVCAYCERRVAERTITLDHVTPRRGQTAYDRRDNLVLCCRSCNAAKADTPILAFLLANRARVIGLFKYGQHLSHQLVEMVKDLLPPDEWPALPMPRAHKAPRRKSARELFGPDDGPSPYLDA
ncbi:MAG: HNH endonuclease [Gemmatimonadaceae bacterium]|nr:HNH endonuclease [Gemmatimonadaceae bacterium]